MNWLQADLIDHMGTDLTVVNAARVSFHKHSELGIDGSISAKDSKLIKYLADNKHWTPFSHTAITFRVRAPVFVRTQAFKHKVGFVENEVSRRYVSEAPVMYAPMQWRYAPDKSIKQGSGYDIPDPENESLNRLVNQHANDSIDLYNRMLEARVAPEMARMVLPQSMMTEWYWTGNLFSFSRFYNLRTDPHAQKEIQELACLIGSRIEPLFPISWQALTT